MNDLQRLIKLKGPSIRQIATPLGVGYHSLQKTIKGVRKTPAMRQAIASYFNVSPDALWGPKSHAVIRYLIEKEIEHQVKRRAKLTREELTKQYLGNSKAA